MSPTHLAKTGAALGIAALAGVALWWRKNPSACPYSQRFWVEMPHPFITPQRLREALEPRAGERVLEVGPGTGYYSLPVAEWLGPDGRLDIFDIQREMLDHTTRRAEQSGLMNIAPARGSAEGLPYDDESFDRAFLVTVLGEVPDQVAALRELHRSLRSGGRLVVGELFGDPHWVSPRSVREGAGNAGFEFERTVGKLIGHYSVFRRP